MTHTDDPCVPCEDGRRLLVAAAAARLAWGLATRRLSAEEADTLAPWGAFAASCVAPVLAYRLALNVRLPRSAALAAGAILAVHPALVDAGTRAAPEAAVPFFAAAALVAWIYAWQSGRLGGAFLSGLCAGAAGLAGAPLAFTGAAWAAAAVWRRREQPRWRALTAAALAAGVLAFSPRMISPVPPAPSTKWSARLAVAPAAWHQAPAARKLFLAVIVVAVLLGLRSVSAGPGGWFVLAWLAASAAAALWTGAGPPLTGDAALAVVAGAGLALLQDRSTANG